MGKDKGKLQKPPVSEVKYSVSDTNFNINFNDFGGQYSNVLEAIEAVENNDPKTFGLIQTRKLSLLSLKREITGEGQEADFVREVFTNIPNMHTILYEMLSAITVGYSITEMVWEELDGKFILKNLIPRKQTLFTFSKNNELLRITEDSQDGEAVSANKFCVVSFMPKYNNKFGTSLLHKVFWYWFLKKNAVKFWAIYTEKFAAPLVIAKETKNMTKETQKRLTKFINNIRTATGVKIPEGVVIEFLQAQQGQNTYNNFINFLDGSMAIAVLGQTLTSDNGKGKGSYALGQVHEKVRQDILQSDIIMLESAINDLIIKPLIDYNFTNVAKYPKWRIVNKGAVNFKEFAEVLNILVSAGMETISVNYIHETFGIPIPNKDEKCLKKKEQNEQQGKDTFAEELTGLGYEC